MSTPQFLKNIDTKKSVIDLKAKCHLGHIFRVNSRTLENFNWASFDSPLGAATCPRCYRIYHLDVFHDDDFQIVENNSMISFIGGD